MLISGSQNQDLQHSGWQADIEELLPPTASGIQKRQACSGGRAIRVLVVCSRLSDKKAIDALVHDALAGECTVDCASDARLALNHIVEDAHDVYLISFGRPVSDALILLRALAECRGPVIALTDSPDEDLNLIALRAGAAECVARPDLSSGALRRAIHHAILRQRHMRHSRTPRLLLEREKDRLNSLQEVSHRLALRACHDIRSPLAVIKSYSAILLGELAESIDADQTLFFQKIMRRVDDVADLLDGMLDASQLASDLVGSHRESVSVEKIFDDLRAALEATATASGGQLGITWPPALPHVFCDRGNIERVIHNLVSRASKAAGTGGRIELWASHDAQDRSVRIGVTDNRPMPPERDEAAVFDPEYQPEPGLKMAASTELESHVIHELVRINLGTFSVTAHPEGGSTSDFTVPLVEDIDRILSTHLGVLACGRQTTSALSVVLASMPHSRGDQHARAVVERIWSELRACDLVVPVRPGAWALCVACNAGDVVAIARRVADSLHERGEHRPDDPVPAISLTILGTWPFSASAEEIASAVRRPQAPDPSQQE